MIVVIGEPTVVLLLGEQWRGAGVAVVAMAGFGPGVAMSAVGTEAMKGCGRSGLLNWLTLASVIVGVGLLLALIPLGLVGVGLALSIDSLFCGFLALLLARRMVGVSLSSLSSCLLPALVATVFAMAAVGVLDRLVIQIASRPPVPAALWLIGEATAFGVACVLVMFAMVPPRARAVARLMTDFIGPGRR